LGEEEQKIMERKKTAVRVALTALAALTLAGALPHPAQADGDKGKKGTVIIGPITTTTDPPPKKK
jgi:hypothetical protein